MDINKLTQKSQEALAEAQSLATRMGHTEVDGEHLLTALIDQPEGLVYYIFSCEDPNEVYSLGKQTLQYYLDNNLYGYMIDTSLEGLA